MTYLEELLPEFRKGAKISRKGWRKDWFIRICNGDIYTQDDEQYDFSLADFTHDCWELYRESIDWDYIIKNKCLCWFWDEGKERIAANFLGSVRTDKFFDINFIIWDNCRPVRRDEVNFYEDKKDE